MKSKPGTVRFSLFLFSIFFCFNLFSQVSLNESKLQLPHSKTLLVSTNASPGFSGLQLSLLADKVAFVKFTLSISDTIRKKDRDGDGIVDSLDKCPDEKGVIQYDGCPIPDSDNDGIADDSDNCPTVAGSIKYNGCPPPDKDGDKINDEDDKCPDQPGVARYGGCPVGDKDGDGVNDDDDKCIDIPGTVNNAGCPENKKSTSPAGKDKTKKKEKEKEKEKEKDL
ncbi:MAG: OmpA family protein [Segetibacter sp.]|nr:OmpA family protein [Segetibacter sp.]